MVEFAVEARDVSKIARLLRLLSGQIEQVGDVRDSIQSNSVR